MRITVTLSDDVAAEVDRLCRLHGIGVSAAINELARAGTTRRPETKPFHQRSAALGLRIDVSSMADVLDVMDTR